MTVFELIRMACYLIAPIALLYKAFSLLHEKHYGGAWLRLFMLLLFAWYMVELTLLGQGIDTRDYRIIGTPMIIGITVVAVAQAVGVWRERRRSKQEE